MCQWVEYICAYLYQSYPILYVIYLFIVFVRLFVLHICTLVTKYFQILMKWKQVVCLMITEHFYNNRVGWTWQWLLSMNTASYKVSIYSWTTDIEAGTHAVCWTALTGDRTHVPSSSGQQEKANDPANRMAGKATTRNSLHLRRSEVLRSLRHYLCTKSKDIMYITKRLLERCRKEALNDLAWNTLEPFPRQHQGILSDIVGHIWVFPQAHRYHPSWTGQWSSEVNIFMCCTRMPHYRANNSTVLRLNMFECINLHHQVCKMMHLGINHVFSNWIDSILPQRSKCIHSCCTLWC